MRPHYFETIQCYNKQPLHLTYHQQRIYTTIGRSFDLQHTIVVPQNGLLKCKVTYNTQTITNIVFEPYCKKEIHSFCLIHDDTIEYNKKQLQRDHINNLFAQKGNADEIIIIKQGLVTDTSCANIAIFDGEKWLTPQTPLLNGTTRARLLDTKILTTAQITVKQLVKSKQIALLNAMIGMDIKQNHSFILR